MATSIEAIYERGVLRLKEPLHLPEGACVEIVVLSQDESRTVKSPAVIIAEIAALPEECAATSFSARDHDALLYGDGHGA